MPDLKQSLPKLEGPSARYFLLLVLERNLPLTDLVVARHGGGYLEYLAPVVGEWWAELLDEAPIARDRAKKTEQFVMTLIMDNNDFFHEDRRARATDALLQIVHTFSLTGTAGRTPAFYVIPEIVDQLVALADIVGPAAAPEAYLPDLAARASAFDASNLAAARQAREQVRGDANRAWSAETIGALRERLRG